MKSIEVQSDYHARHQLRFNRTLDFIREAGITSEKILDLGPPNPLSDLLLQQGFNVTNTLPNQDLDEDFSIVEDTGFEVVTAFEILEHMVSPYPLLKSIAARKLIISVPLSMWFARAYWSETDPYDRHYHEFEPRQIVMLLEKAGWKVVKEKKYTSYDLKPAIRTIFRMITPRHYFLYCIRE